MARPPFAIAQAAVGMVAEESADHSTGVYVFSSAQVASSSELSGYDWFPYTGVS